MLPSFLGIGAQKSGTTWLHAMLSSHPGLWLPHRKELHYFDQKYPAKRAQSGHRPRPGRGLIVRRIIGRARRVQAADVLRRFATTSWRNLSWDLRYFFGGWNDDWYESLFDGAGSRLAGEITPAYSCLESQAIARVKILLPDVKLLLLLRDPVERAWSHAKMEIGTGAGADADFITHFSGSASRQRGDYVGMIDRWTRYYDPAQLFIGFYDDIQRNPVDLLERIFRFLRVDASPSSIPHSARMAVNAGSRDPIPLHLHRHLANIYAPDLAQLADRFGGYPDIWYERCKSVLSGA
jgi:hypothetical protein